MNDDAKSDIAAVTYCNDSDLVELWTTKFHPFSETGFWVRIPGIRYKLLEIAMESRVFVRRDETGVNSSD